MAKENVEDEFAPRQNPHLQGHEEAEQEFLNVIGLGRLHHAWLICGPRGIGKATLAYRMARYLLAHKSYDVGNSEQLLDLDFDHHSKNHVSATTSLFLPPEHPVFRHVAAGSHADFLAVERRYDEKKNKRQKFIGIGDNKTNPEPNTIRFVGAFLRKTAVEGGYRVVVIDSVDELSINAAHALLKILEEPPEQTLLLLVSHNPGTLLPTIRSRCRRLSLKPLNVASVVSLIQRHAPETEEDKVQQLIDLSNGSIGTALRLLVDDGLDMLDLVNTLLSDLPALDVPLLDQLGNKVYQERSGKAFRTLFFIFSHQVMEIVKNKAISGAPPNGEINKWIDVWEETNSLFLKAESVNLDRKQVILNAFFAAASAVRDDASDMT